MTSTSSDRVRTFRALHESGLFVMPNPWDIGSAVALEQLGFPAVATTSCGFAWSVGRQDNHVPLDAVLEHLSALAGRVSVPVNADFEDGLARKPEDVARNVERAAHTGIAGLSIEDSTRGEPEPLIDFSLSVERIRAAREAIDATGTGVVLTGRSEGFVAGRPDLDETIRRLTAYAEAGADCLYAPGVHEAGQIRAIVQAVSPKPVNVGVGSDFTTVGELAEIGVRRVSVGGGLARAAWKAFLEAAREIAEHGTFARLGHALPYAEVNGLFRGH